MNGLLTRPALHFWLIGLLLFTLQSAFEPAPLLQVNYPSTSRIAELERQLQQFSSGAISEADKANIIQAEIDQSILLNEAIRHDFHIQDNMVRQRLIHDMRFMYEQSTDSDEELLDQAYAMDLHKNDLVVRRRLIQMMESGLRATGENQPVEEQALQSAYLEAGEKFTHPERFSFAHVFVSRDRHLDETGEYATTLMRDIHSESVVVDAAIELGDPFITGHFVAQLSLEQISLEFGAGFAEGIRQCQVRQWCEAVESVYGLHHIWLQEKLSSEPLPFDVVKDKLEYELRIQAGNKVLAESLELLRGRYQVVGAAG